MKPTQVQLDQLTATVISEPGDMTQAVTAVITHWESIRPADDPDRWIPLSERRPTKEDADECDCVSAFSDRREVWHIKWDKLHNYKITHWKRTNLPPPKEPTSEEIEAKEIEAAWDKDHDLDSFKAGWLAHKSKTAKP